MSSVVSNPQETHIFAILTPAKGKMDRLKSLMETHITATHKNEDYTVRYLMTEPVEPSAEPALYMFETYKSKDGADKHTQTDNFKALMVAAEKEEGGLWGKDPLIVMTKTIGGFDWDRKLV